MEVYKPGTTVELTDGITAIIIAINIDSNCKIQYEVVWWASRERKTSWVEPFEIKVFGIGEQLKIGFNQCQSHS